ncbi:unnamed protein product [Musa acuminata subsp. malaccensis]|uniref:(wild Malaysian banana) hypothetical protein n=1 Tax=Musa acuminata subsp. malaccensis TaxID=214687 RepID=A0A804IGC0_MUSAM|nr:unnamed protein product [Musa acuminata subsp. malaccensis]
MATDAGFFSRKSFKDVDCTDDMVGALRGLMFLRPSHIQEEILGLGKASSRSPRVIILVPTAELASQVGVWCHHHHLFLSLSFFLSEPPIVELDLYHLVLMVWLKYHKLPNTTSLINLSVLFDINEKEFIVFCLVLKAQIKLETNYCKCMYNTVQIMCIPRSCSCDILRSCIILCRSLLFLVDCSGADGEEKNPDTALKNKKYVLLQLLEEWQFLKQLFSAIRLKFAERSRMC